MFNSIDLYFLVQVINLVEDAIITKSKSVSFSTGQFDRLMCSRIVCQCLKGFCGFSGNIWWEVYELS
jgi:hypothetical protein